MRVKYLKTINFAPSGSVRAPHIECREGEEASGIPEVDAMRMEEVGIAEIIGPDSDDSDGDSQSGDSKPKPPWGK